MFCVFFKCFSLMFFPFKVNNIHIFSPTHVVPLPLIILPPNWLMDCKCSTWACFLDLPSQLAYGLQVLNLSLLLGFALPIGLCCHVDGIRISSIHFGSNYLFSSYLQDVLNENVRHVNAFPRLGVVYVAFGIFSWCFVQRPYYLLYYCSPPPSPPRALFWVSMPTWHFLFNYVGSFWKAFRPRLFGMPLSSFNLLVGLPLHFLWSLSFIFIKGNAIAYLKLGFISPHHIFWVLVRLSCIFIRSNRNK